MQTDKPADVHTRLALLVHHLKPYSLIWRHCTRVVLLVDTGLSYSLGKRPDIAQAVAATLAVNSRLVIPANSDSDDTLAL